MIGEGAAEDEVCIGRDLFGCGGGGDGQLAGVNGAQARIAGIGSAEAVQSSCAGTPCRRGRCREECLLRRASAKERSEGHGGLSVCLSWCILASQPRCSVSRGTSTVPQPPSCTQHCQWLQLLWCDSTYRALKL